MTSRSVLVPWVLMRSVISPFCLCQNSIAWHQLRFGIFLWIVRILVLESKKNRTSREFLQHDWGACFSAFFFRFPGGFPGFPQASPRLPPGFPQASPRLPPGFPQASHVSTCLPGWFDPGRHAPERSLRGSPSGILLADLQWFPSRCQWQEGSTSVPHDFPYGRNMAMKVGQFCIVLACFCTNYSEDSRGNEAGCRN